MGLGVWGGGRGSGVQRDGCKSGSWVGTGGEAVESEGVMGKMAGPPGGAAIETEDTTEDARGARVVRGEVGGEWPSAGWAGRGRVHFV